MNELVLNKKKYIVLTRNEYDRLRKKAALKAKPEKTFTIEEARTYSKSLIRKWAKES